MTLWWLCALSCLLCTGFPAPVQPAKILIISHGFPSHMFILHEIGRELLDHGHEVYTVFNTQMKDPLELRNMGFKIIWYQRATSAANFVSEHRERLVARAALEKNAMLEYVEDSKTSLDECMSLDADETAKRQISDLKFDFVLVDIFPLSYCFTFLPMMLKVPFAVAPPNLEIEQFRSGIFPSVVPHPVKEYSEKMTFWERCRNLFFFLTFNNQDLSPFPAVTSRHLVRKYRTDPAMETWNDVARKASLVFLSRDYLTEWPVPLLPHIIPLEGITARPAEDLPADLEDILQSAEHGVVVVSFGSTLKWLPRDVTEKFLDAFRMREEVFLWRFKVAEGDRLNIPSNVKMTSWLPQNDVLGHSNVKLFLTHAGNNGLYEALFHAVPTVTVPMFAEQHHNAYRNDVHEFGVSIDLSNFTATELAQKMALVMTDPKYRKNIEKVSQMLHRRPMNAHEVAVYWIEHVLEFGDKELRSHALDMPWYSYYMVDIFLLVIIVSHVFIVFSCGFCYFIVSKVCKRKTKETKEKTN